MQCRMYEKSFPDVGDVVMVKVANITSINVYVELVEYNNIEGMVLMSDMSRKRIRSTKILTRIGKYEPMVVLRTDPTRNYIDLTRRRISDEEKLVCEEKFNKSKIVHSILLYVAQVHKLQPQVLYEQFGWDLYRRFGHALDAFYTYLKDPMHATSQVFLPCYNIDLILLKTLTSEIRKRLTPKPLKIRADIELTCFQYEGIDAIKRALKAAQVMSTNEYPIKIHLIAAPHYILTMLTPFKETGLLLLNHACEAIQKQITSEGGQLLIIREAHVVSNEEEDAQNIKTLMVRAEREICQVSGDDDHDD